MARKKDREKHEPRHESREAQAVTHPHQPLYMTLLALVFLANAAIMSIELVASPLVARHLGQSLYTWTTIIGVVLGGMALGHYLGGRLSDRVPARRLLPVLLAVAAGAVLLLLPLNALLGNLAPLQGLPWPPRIFLHVLLMFFLPSLALGTVNPVAARLCLAQGRGAGRTVGGVYASAAAGSIIGVFITGFWLVAWFRLSLITWMIAGALLLLAAVAAILFRRLPGEQAEPPTPEAAPLRSEGAGNWRLGAVYNATVFLSNASFMVLELVVSRLATQFFGHSLYTWTTILGVVLAGITLGNYAGGRLADRYASKRLIALLFAAGAVACLLLPWWHGQLIAAEAFTGMSWTARLVLHSLLAFLLPSAIMGAIGPCVAKLALLEERATGLTLGGLYAWAALGSVVGVFLTGYFLIDLLWPGGTLALLALLMAAAGSLYNRRAWWSHAVTALALAALILVSLPGTEGFARSLGMRRANVDNLLYEDQSQYSWVGVTSAGGDENWRKLILDNLYHSEIHLEYPLNLFFHFWWIYAAVLDTYHPAPEPVNALVIGGGGYVFPRYIELTRPESYIEVAEIDPAVTKAAREHFGFPEDSSIEVYHVDGRNRVEQLVRQKAAGEDVPAFDVIYGDSINQFSVPFQLTTLEFNEMIDALLAEDGLYLLNTTDRYDSARFLAAVLKTCRQVWPHVYAFSSRPLDIERHDSFVVVCAHRELDLSGVGARIRAEHPFYEGVLLTQEQIDELIARTDARVLTDDYAPVDNLVARLDERQEAGEYEQREQQSAEEAKLALALVSQGQAQQALGMLDSLIERYPNNPLLLEGKGRALGMLGQTEQAEAVLREAIAAAPLMASPHVSLARALNLQGRHTEALAEIEAALELDPHLLDAQALRAQTLAQLGQKQEAWALYERLTEENPDDAWLQLAYVDALKRTGETAKAAEVLEGLLEQQPENPQLHFLLGEALLHEAQYEAAAGHLQQVLEAQPDYVPARVHLATAYQSLGRLEEARELLEETVAQAPPMPQVHAALGSVLRDLGEVEEARRQIVRALELDPRNAQARALLRSLPE